MAAFSEHDSINEKYPADPALAEIMRKIARVTKHKTMEKIVATDWLLTAHNRGRLNLYHGVRIVDLECGHKAVTKARGRIKCKACEKMILEGRDYHKFRFLDRGLT